MWYSFFGKVPKVPLIFNPYACRWDLLEICLGYVINSKLIYGQRFWVFWKKVQSLWTFRNLVVLLELWKIVKICIGNSYFRCVIGYLILDACFLPNLCRSRRSICRFKPWICLRVQFINNCFLTSKKSIVVVSMTICVPVCPVGIMIKDIYRKTP